MFTLSYTTEKYTTTANNGPVKFKYYQRMHEARCTNMNKRLIILNVSEKAAQRLSVLLISLIIQCASGRQSTTRELLVLGKLSQKPQNRNLLLPSVGRWPLQAPSQKSGSVV